MPFSHTSNSSMCEHFWTPINVSTVPFLCTVSLAVATCGHRLPIFYESIPLGSQVTAAGKHGGECGEGGEDVFAGNISACYRGP